MKNPHGCLKCNDYAAEVAALRARLAEAEQRLRDICAVDKAAPGRKDCWIWADMLEIAVSYFPDREWRTAASTPSQPNAALARVARQHGYPDVAEMLEAGVQSSVAPCDHEWESRHDWMGDPEVPGGVYSFDWSECVKCGLKDSIDGAADNGSAG